MKKILLTGGSGQIGKKSIPLLKKHGYEIDNYDIRNNPEDDIFNYDRLLERLKRVDIVYHLAAIPHPFKGHEVDYKKMNYDGAKIVFNAAAKSGVKKFLFSSSGCAYGFWGGFAKPEKFPLAEDNKCPSIEDGQTLYGYLKVAFEQYMARESEKVGMKSISLRLEGIGSEKKEDFMERIWDDNGKMPVGSCAAYHYFACCSLENYSQLLQLVIEKELESSFEVFNVGNQYVHESIRVQEEVQKRWPHIPNYTKDNETLYSIEKAKKMLGYRPVR